jgi:hypothetical protein
LKTGELSGVPQFKKFKLDNSFSIGVSGGNSKLFYNAQVKFTPGIGVGRKDVAYWVYNHVR